MRLRTALLAAITLLVAAIVGATVFAVVTVIGRAERRDLEAELVRSNRVFDELLAHRASMLRSDCRIVANEPRLRATLATLDITRETVVGVVGELRTALGRDLFLLTDGRGTLTADSLDPEAHGFDLSARPAIAEAIKSSEGAAVWVTNDRPHQVAACRVDFGARTVGIVVIGEAFDDDAAVAVHRQTGSTLVVATDGKRVAGSPLANGRPVPDDVRAIVGAPAGFVHEHDVSGQRYAVIGGPVPGYTGKRIVTYAMMRSLDEALAPARQLTRSVLLIAMVVLFAGLIVALLLARRLSKPVDELVQFTRKVAAGTLDARAKPSGAREIKALASAMNVMVEELDKSRAQLAAKERLEREMEIAMRIQTSMLPQSFDVNGLDIAAVMLPATEVGGDYSDVLPVNGGCWIGIGDVAGHGLTAGLEMLMVQSIIAALVRENSAAAPREHLRVLNHVVYENIRHRLGQDEHITLTLLHVSAGKVTFAGAHETILIARAAGGACEEIATPGTWIGGTRDIGRVTVDTTLELEIGDLMVLYSDGITEAMNERGEMFGIDRLCREVEARRTEPVEAIRDGIIAVVKAWQFKHQDDISLLVIRRDQTS
ncbi:MAG TPA: SpoIIE family protein phosphatase [Kofleriaceae bacterium]